MKKALLLAIGLSIVLATCPILISCTKSPSNQSDTTGQAAARVPAGPAQESEFQAYAWQDDQGTSYMAIQSRKPISPDQFLPKDAGLYAVPASAKAPVQERAGFQVTTYRLVRPQQSKLPLIEGKAAPCIYLLGETHLGKSQKDAGRVLCQLIREHEIDAVFVEQPDDLKYDWSRFEKLAENPSRAIAAVQYRMLSDADKVIEAPKFSMGKYERYFKNGDAGSQDGLKQILMNIYRDYGEKGAIDAMNVLKKQDAIFKDLEPRVEASQQSYNNSEYISAADYLYILLNVQGIRIPFYNVDSAALRKDFETQANKLDLDPRDNYMTRSIKTTVAANGYRQVILICGALHLKNQRRNFISENYTVQTSYDSLPDGIKHEMAVLSKPEYVTALALQGPPPGFRSSSVYMVENAPSTELLSRLDSYFRAASDENLAPQVMARLRASFMEQYAKQRLKEKTAWSVDLDVGGGESLTVSKDVRSNSFTVTKQEPVGALAIQNFEKAGPNNHLFDYRNAQRLDRINRDNPSVRFFTVEDKLTHYEVYSGTDGKLLNNRGTPEFALEDLM
ncbi:MAG: hypothetical protein ACREAC_00835, partial [Blastocatellia bacterium]